MSLRRNERRTVARIERSLRRADPELAGMFVAFNRLDRGGSTTALIRRYLTEHRRTS